MNTITLVPTSLRTLRSLAIGFAVCATSLRGAPALRNGPDSTVAKNGASAQSSRMRAYVSDLAGLGAIAIIGIGAAIDQGRNNPAEWGRSGSGFAKRVGSAAGAHSAQVTVRHGLAAALDRSTSYTRCACSDAGGRIANGIVSTVTDRDSHGRRAFSEPILAGAVAGGFVPLIWRPDYDARQAALNTAFSLGITAAGNIAREFISWWP